MPDDRTELLMRLAHEMLDALKRIWDRRQHARGQIFANEVDAIMAEIRLSHDDFLSILNSLKRILRQLLHIVESRPNDVKARLDTLEGELYELHNKRGERRIMRREMFEATVWAESKDRNSTVARKVVISAEESDLLRQFHGCVARYFRQDGHEYKHDTPRYLERVHHLIDSAEIVSDTKKTKEQIQSTAADIGAYEHKLEGVFGEIARRYAALKSQLPAQ